MSSHFRPRLVPLDKTLGLKRGVSDGSLNGLANLKFRLETDDPQSFAYRVFRGCYAACGAERDSSQVSRSYVAA